MLRFLPPYILERAHVDVAIKALDEIFTEQAPRPVSRPRHQHLQEETTVASRATMERRDTAIPVQKDEDILAAAARLAGEDLCSIADLSSV